MSNIEIIESLLSAIEHDRFSEIGALHNATAVFQSFRGPTVSGGWAIADWYHSFLVDYADCTYVARTFLADGNSVALQATIAAKSADWRPFEQRMLEVADLEAGGISARRIYAMPAGFECPKPVLNSLARLKGNPGGGAAATAGAAHGFFEAIIHGNRDGAGAYLAADAVLADGVFGLAEGSANVLDLITSMPVPAFGRWRLARAVDGASAAAIELTIAPTRPRAACWVQVADEKVAVIEVYWMLREIGVAPGVASFPRHPKQVILPI